MASRFDLGRRQYVLAFDLGTGGVKAALFSEDLELQGHVFVEYPSLYPKPGWVEQDPQEWWAAMKTALTRLLAKGDVYPSQIAVIGVDTMAPVIVACDVAGAALRPAVIWMDRRAVSESNRIEERIGTTLFDINGNHNDPSNFAPKVMWIKQNEPDIYRKTALFHSAAGYLVHRLTGQACMDVTQCGLSQLCDTRRSEWDATLIAGCGLDGRRLPPISESTAVVGTVSVATARELGLVEGIPVIAGAMDNVAAGLGLGVIERDEAYVSAGTATNLCVCTDKPKYIKEFHLYRHIVPNRFLSVAGVDYGGAGTKWIKSILGDIDFTEINRLVTGSVDNEIPMIYLPYMVGQRAPLWNDVTTGVLMGIHPSVRRDDLLRTMMEGNAVALREVAELFRKRGYHVKLASLTGGASHSEANCRIFSDALGIPLDIFDESDVAVRGIAMAAAFGAGIYTSFETLVKRVHAQKRIEPEMDRTTYYREMSGIFRSVYGKLQDEFQALAMLRARYHKEKE